uniref:Uncharacterized protein n=1 Tax=Anguilla anguilla TaxID=7936 RepID=A0A0E9PWB6_ANGAN
MVLIKCCFIGQHCYLWINTLEKQSQVPSPGSLLPQQLTTVSGFGIINPFCCGLTIW